MSVCENIAACGFHFACVAIDQIKVNSILNLAVLILPDSSEALSWILLVLYSEPASPCMSFGYGRERGEGGGQPMAFGSLSPQQQLFCCCFQAIYRDHPSTLCR